MIELTIFFDLETLPTADAALIDDIASSILPPARMTKAETISRWEIEEIRHLPSNDWRAW